ncbi:unnamed protein product [Clonostachys chloroleuca]|uniref:DUF7730 domain-containing protein n=1 Tax=Clonostachys chloroleuca TaxID=1926264 RepID=A0AA35Q7P1_9HYPO|nr:unnamed protein product [Clonostachys chloroleuca]
MITASPEILHINPNPWHIPRPKKLTFMHLPPEVRLRIYEFVLVEIPRWDKKHHLKCRCRPRLDSDDTEHPPFLQSMVKITPVPPKFHIATTTRCDCAKRKGLSLLLASREINQAASPIFWSLNTFCFLDSMEFLATVGHRLRPKHQQRIQSVSFMSPDARGMPRHVRLYGRRRRHIEPFWQAIRKCTRLRHLELPAWYINPAHFNIHRSNQLAKALPHLQSLEVSHLLPYSNKAHSWGYPSPWYKQPEERTFYVRCSRRVPLVRDGSWTNQAAKDLFRELQHNFRVHVDTAVKTKLLGATIDGLEEYRTTFRLPRQLDEHNCLRRIKLPSGETTTIRFYGLRTSKQTRLHVVQEKKALDRKQRLKNNRTHAQQEAMDKEKQRKWQRRRFEEDFERRRHDLDLKQRDSRLSLLKKKEEKQSRKLARAIKRAEDKRKSLRQSERKKTIHINNY